MAASKGRTLKGRTLKGSKLILSAKGNSLYPAVIPVKAAAVAGSYTLTCSAGSYSLTGVSATLLRKRSLTASAGSYTLTGASAILERDRRLTSSAGAYSVTGVNASLSKNRTLTASAGSYAQTGVTANITYTPGATNYTLTALAGSYSVTGASAVLKRDRKLTPSAGSYSQTGVNATLKVDSYLIASAGSYSLTGQSAGITYFSGPANNYTLTCLAGSYSYGEYVNDGYVEPGYIGSTTLTIKKPIAEVELSKKWYVKRKNQIHLFNSAEEADAFIESEAVAEEAIKQAQKTSRRARKRLREKVYEATGVTPVETVQIDWLAQLVARYAIPVNLPEIIAQQDFERVMQIRALALEMQDEEEVELLLLA